MSYTMTHLIIANEFAEKHGVQNKGLFLLASIAPDAVHARKDYSKSLKERSHLLQAGVEWGTVCEEEPMNVWYGELREFYRQKLPLCVENEARDFLNGYALHILTDIFDCQKMYAPALKRYGADIERFRKEYGKQNLQWDAFLYRSCSERGAVVSQTERAYKTLENSGVLETLGLDRLISAENIADMLAYQIRQYENAENVSVSAFEMISQALSDAFIEYVGRQSARMLFDFPKLDRVFAV